MADAQQPYILSVNHELHPGTPAGAVRAQSLDDDGGNGPGPLQGANITCRHVLTLCSLFAGQFATTSNMGPFPDFYASSAWTDACPRCPHVLSHWINVYRGRQLTLVGGPLLEPFAAAFQGRLALLAYLTAQKTALSL